MSPTQEELIRSQERNAACQIAALINKRYPLDARCIIDALATTQGPRVMRGDLGFVWKFDCYGNLGKVRFITAQNKWQAYWHMPDIYPEKEPPAPTTRRTANMSDTQQRTGNFGARTTLRRSKEPAPRLDCILHHMTASIENATNDGRTYTVKIEIKANITVEPCEAEIGEYVPTGYFEPNQDDQVLENPDAHMKKRVFQHTSQGYQRIE